MKLDFFHRKEAVAFRAAARHIVPLFGEEAPKASDLKSLLIVDRYMAGADPVLKKRFRLFLRVLEWGSALLFGKPFSRLDPRRARAYLRLIELSPLRLLRQGFWGLKTMVLFGYYTRQEVFPHIHYDGPNLTRGKTSLPGGSEGRVEEVRSR